MFILLYQNIILILLLSGGSSSTNNQQPMAAEPPINNKPIPRGHAARDRASLRLKQRKEMEKQMKEKSSSRINSDGKSWSYVLSTLALTGY